MAAKRPTDMFLSRHQMMQTHDLELCNETLRRMWRPHHGLQPIGAGPFSFQMNLAPLAQSALAYFEIKGRMKLDGGALPNHYTLAVPLSGTLTFRQNREVVSVNPHMGLVSSAGQEHQIWHTGTIRLLNVKLERAVLERELAHLLDRPVGRPLQFALALNLRCGIGPSLIRFLRYLTDELEQRNALHSQASLAVRQSERLLVTMLLESQPHNYWDELHGPAPDTAAWQVRWAEEFARARLQHPLSVADLAAAAGVSGRALRNAFRRHRGCSPMQFVRQLRLEAVRRDLLSAEPGVTVSEVALRWGFEHFGRFAAQYRHTYHERPSETLRR